VITCGFLEAVLRAIPDEVVVREPAPTRRGRTGTSPPIPRDVLGPLIRVVVLTAAMTPFAEEAPAEPQPAGTDPSG
jgi:hypothetical protein